MLVPHLWVSCFFCCDRWIKVNLLVMITAPWAALIFCSFERSIEMLQLLKNCAVISRGQRGSLHDVTFSWWKRLFQCFRERYASSNLWHSRLLMWFGTETQMEPHWKENLSPSHTEMEPHPLCLLPSDPLFLHPLIYQKYQSHTHTLARLRLSWV